MLKHLFKLIWNKKRQNILLIIEIFVSFFVLFVISCFLAYVFQNFKSKKGFSSENIKVVEIKMEGQQNIFSDSIEVYHEAIVNALQQVQGVQSFSFSDFAVPYVLGSHISNIKYKGKKVFVDNYFKDDAYANLMGMHMKSGRWFNKTDEDSTKNTIVINESLKEKLFGNEDAIGKQIHGVGGDDQKWNVVGVVEDTKNKSDYLPAYEGVYLRLSNDLKKATTTLLIKENDGANATIDANINKSLSSIVKNATIDIQSLDENRKKKNLIVLVPALIFIVICFFLISNVCLGLFGVLVYNINKRKSEIGLRKALGATSRSILVHFVGEAWVLATFSILIGLFFAVQFPLLHVLDLPSGIYITGIISSILFIYFIVLLCALYPSRQASRVYPAQVLHEE